MEKALALKVTARNIEQARRQIEDFKRALDEVKRSQEGAKNAAEQARRVVEMQARAQQVLGQAAAVHARATSQHQAAVSKLRGEFRGLWTGVRTGAMIATGAVVALGGALAGVTSLVKAFERNRGFKMALEFNLGPEKAAAVHKQLRARAEALGINEESAKGGILKLASTGKTGADELLPIIEAFTALARTSGADANQQSRAFGQFTQIASQGQLQGDELRAIQENGVQLRRLLTDAGIQTGDAKNPVQFEQIKEVLLAFGQTEKAQKLLKESSTFASASLAQLENVLQQELIPMIGETLSPALKEAAQVVTKWIKELDKEKVKQFVSDIVEATRSTVVLIAKYWEAIETTLKVTAGLALLLKAIRLVQGISNVIATRSFVSLSGAAWAAAAALDKLALSGGAVAAAGAAAGGVGVAAGGGIIAGIVAWIAKVKGWLAPVIAVIVSFGVAIAWTIGVVGAAIAAFLLIVKGIETVVNWIRPGTYDADSSFFNGERWLDTFAPSNKARREEAERPITPADLAKAREELSSAKRELGGADVNRLQNRLNYEGMR